VWRRKERKETEKQRSAPRTRRRTIITENRPYSTFVQGESEGCLTATFLTTRASSGIYKGSLTVREQFGLVRPKRQSKGSSSNARHPMLSGFSSPFSAASERPTAHDRPKVTFWGSHRPGWVWPGQGTSHQITISECADKLQQCGANESKRKQHKSTVMKVAARACCSKTSIVVVHRDLHNPVSLPASCCGFAVRGRAISRTFFPLD